METELELELESASDEALEAITDDTSAELLLALLDAGEDALLDVVTEELLAAALEELLEATAEELLASSAGTWPLKPVASAGVNASTR